MFRNSSSSASNPANNQSSTASNQNLASSTGPGIYNGGLKLGQKHSIYFLAAISFLFFLITFAVFSFTKHTDSDAFLLVLCAFFLCLIYHTIAVNTSGPYGNSSYYSRSLSGTIWKWIPLFSTSISVLLGVVLGEYNYASNYSSYLSFSMQSRSYSNINPSNRGEIYSNQHGGGAVFSFSQDAFLDDSRVYRYANDQNHNSAENYCVAPIVSDSLVLGQSPVHFWAVGKNCCGEHGRGFWCTDEINVDSSNDINSAQNGSNYVVPKITRAISAVSDGSYSSEELRIFTNASKSAASRYGFNIQSQHSIILLHLTPDPYDAIDSYRRRADRFFIIVTILVCCFYGLLFWFISPGKNSTSVVSEQWVPEHVARAQEEQRAREEEIRNSQAAAGAGTFGANSVFDIFRRRG